MLFFTVEQEFDGVIFKQTYKVRTNNIECANISTSSPNDVATAISNQPFFIQNAMCTVLDYVSTTFPVTHDPPHARLRHCRPNPENIHPKLEVVRPKAPVVRRRFVTLKYTLIPIKSLAPYFFKPYRQLKRTIQKNTHKINCRICSTHPRSSIKGAI